MCGLVSHDRTRMARHLQPWRSFGLRPGILRVSTDKEFYTKKMKTLITQSVYWFQRHGGVDYIYCIFIFYNIYIFLACLLRILEWLDFMDLSCFNFPRNKNLGHPFFWWLEAVLLHIPPSVDAYSAAAQVTVVLVSMALKYLLESEASVSVSELRTLESLDRL